MVNLSCFPLPPRSTPLFAEHRQLAPQKPLLEDYNAEHEVPPVPPQRLESSDIRTLQLNRPALAEYDIHGTQGSLRSPRLPLRRTSSTGELEESIKHLQVYICIQPKSILVWNYVQYTEEVGNH